MSALVIARLTFREAARRWILWVATLLGILFLVIYTLGFNSIYRDVQQQSSVQTAFEFNEIFNFLFLAGIYAVNFLTAMMAVLTSVDTLSGEIATGTIQTLVSKPLRRWEIVLGKWIGFNSLLLAYLVLMSGGVIGIVYFLSGYVAPHLLQGLALLALNTVLLVSVTLMGGASLSTLANGVLVFGLYGVAFLGGWIEQFGALLGNQAAINIGVVCSLILPSEALWKRAAFEMQSPLMGLMGFSPFVANTVPSPLMLVYTAVYVLVAVGFTLQRFGKRDL